VADPGLVGERGQPSAAKFAGKSQDAAHACQQDTLRNGNGSGGGSLEPETTLVTTGYGARKRRDTSCLSCRPHHRPFILTITNYSSSITCYARELPNIPRVNDSNDALTRAYSKEHRSTIRSRNARGRFIAALISISSSIDLDGETTMTRKEISRDLLSSQESRIETETGTSRSAKTELDLAYARKHARQDTLPAGQRN